MSLKKLIDYECNYTDESKKELNCIKFVFDDEIMHYGFISNMLYSDLTKIAIGRNTCLAQSVEGALNYFAVNVDEKTYSVIESAFMEKIKDYL